MDRDAGAGQVLEMLCIVLVAENVAGGTDLQGRPDAVRTDELLGVAEAGNQQDLVKVPFEVGVRGSPAEHQAGLVGEDDAHRLTVELLVQAAQHRFGAAGEPAVGVGIPDVGQLDFIGGNLQVTRAPPRGQNGGAHAARFDGFRGKESDPAQRQVVPVTRYSIGP